MVSIIIPTYNEEASIGGLLERISEIASEKDWEIIVVDDGSTDKTPDIVKRYNFVNLVRHPYNKGNGAAVKKGISVSQAEFVVVLDADDQHNPDDIEILLSHLDEYDLVIGARNINSYSNIFRKVGNLFLNKLAGFLVDMNIPDLTSGFRAFKKEKVLKFMHLYPNGFSFPTTSTLSFITAGYDVKFASIKMKLRDKDSKSKIKITKDGARFFLLILRIVTLYNPLKIFVPTSLFLFIIGTLYALVYIYLIMHIPAGAVLAVLSSFIIFFFGLIADQISCLRREIK